MTTFGDQLRSWRAHRRISQLELSADAGVSQRHLSFLETGRSKPSREMVLHLARRLDVPLRARNEWLASAGFASVHAERTWTGDELGHVRHVIRRMLEAHEPFPAYAIDRAWNLLEANRPAATLVALILPPDSPADLGANVLRLSLHPDGIRRYVTNWPAVAGVLVDRLRRECADRPGDAVLADLLAEVEAYPGIGVGDLVEPRPGDLLVPLEIDHPVLQVSLFTTITTIGSAVDVTLDEVRLETLLPASPEAEARLREL